MGGTRARDRIPVDERLVMPETRYEIIDGEVFYVSPAGEAHGTRHTILSALLSSHVARDYRVALDMLTRTSEKSDFAPDASIYPAARDPETGGRQLEELAFEIMSTQRASLAGRKAAALIARGVRRVFAIDIKRDRVLEWSRDTGGWQMMDPRGAIEDRTLIRPLAIEALAGAASEDDAVANALIAKENPVLEAAFAEKAAVGKAEGKAEAVLAILEARGIAVTPREAARIRKTRDDKTLSRWIRSAVTCASTAELDRASKKRSGAQKKKR